MEIESKTQIEMLFTSREINFTNQKPLQIETTLLLLSSDPKIREDAFLLSKNDFVKNKITMEN